MPEPEDARGSGRMCQQKVNVCGGVPSSERRPSATCSGCERRPSPRKRSGAAGDRHALARAEADQVGLELSEGGQDVEER